VPSASAAAAEGCVNPGQTGRGHGQAPCRDRSGRRAPRWPVAERARPSSAHGQRAIAQHHARQGALRAVVHHVDGEAWLAGRTRPRPAACCGRRAARAPRPRRRSVSAARSRAQPLPEAPGSRRRPATVRVAVPAEASRRSPPPTDRRARRRLRRLGRPAPAPGRATAHASTSAPTVGSKAPSLAATQRSAFLQPGEQIGSGLEGLADRRGIQPRERGPLRASRRAHRPSARSRPARRSAAALSAAASGPPVTGTMSTLASVPMTAARRARRHRAPLVAALRPASRPSPPAKTRRCAALASRSWHDHLHHRQRLAHSAADGVRESVEPATLTMSRSTRSGSASVLPRMRHEARGGHVHARGSRGRSSRPRGRSVRRAAPRRCA
jgi:hypothetical protein